jgi:hypothetical protein
MLFRFLLTPYSLVGTCTTVSVMTVQELLWLIVAAEGL